MILLILSETEGIAPSNPLILARHVVLVSLLIRSFTQKSKVRSLSTLDERVWCA
ncbi:hypothetical protein [Allocoleopsis sp.]|uniref:hypothetical protein n=1 Tax=Allocoleopsis sp. TaxID=3088169 RepID=UPI002FD3097C